MSAIGSCDRVLPFPSRDIGESAVRLIPIPNQYWLCRLRLAVLIALSAALLRVIIDREME